MKTTVLRNDEDLLNFMRGMWNSEPSIKYPSNMTDARRWLQANELEPPKKYPCHVEFTSQRVELDDVGFGSYTENRMRYTYKEDYEREIKAAQKKLQELVWLEKYFYTK